MLENFVDRNDVFVTASSVSLSLTRTFQRRRNVNIAIVVASVVLMNIYTLIAPFKYTADTTLYQADVGFLDDADIANPLKVFSATQQQTPIDKFGLVMQSRAVAKMLIEKQGLDKILFEKMWDSKTKSWHPPSGPIQWLKGIWLGLYGLPAWTPPDDKQLADFLASHIDSTLSDSDNTLELSFQYKDPAIAAKVLSSLVEDTNLVIQKNQIAALDAAYALIAQRLNTSGNVDLRTASAQLASQSLLEVTKATARNAEINALDPIRVSPSPTSPRPLMNNLIGVLIGGLIIGIWYLSEFTVWTIRTRLREA